MKAMHTAPEYDPRYLAGIQFFNQRDFIEAHEVWEDLWADTPGPERRFFQGLIQAAVALYHFGNGNVRGARKLFLTSQAYMRPFGDTHQGLDCKQFWEHMSRCFAEVLACENPDRRLIPDEALIPIIFLNPEPDSWPDPRQLLTSQS
jgi:predicted metal-dependent hydrolase